MNQVEPLGAPHIPALLAAGFRRVGCWRKSNMAGNQMELDFVAEREPGVYAYVVDGIVHYVGSAQLGLNGCFRRYTINKTMQSFERVRVEIISLLEARRVVEIYSLIPAAYGWQRLPADLISGIREDLIRQLRPKWNVQSNRGEK